MFLINTGVPTPQRQARRRNAPVRYTEQTIDFAASNKGVTELNTALPISEIECRLRGNVTFANDADAPRNGAIDLIQKLEVRIDGDTPVMSFSGWLIPFLSICYYGHAPYGTDVAQDDTDTDFDLVFRLPVDVGGRLSLLNPAAHDRITVECTWAADGTAIAADSSDGAVTLSNTKLDIVTISPSVIDPAGLGGDQNNYWRHVITQQQYPVNATTDDLRVELQNYRQYGSVIMATESDSAWVDNVLNDVETRVGQTDLGVWTRQALKAEQDRQFTMDGTVPTGFYRLTYARENELDMLLTVDGQYRPELVFDVTKQGTTDRLYVISDYTLTPDGG